VHSYTVPTCMQAVSLVAMLAANLWLFASSSDSSCWATTATTQSSRRHRCLYSAGSDMEVACPVVCCIADCQDGSFAAAAAAAAAAA
jgi:hypothetical protein